ncbi:hypothetical protein [Phenylobacterium sp.]|uniref:hypothetical protein n=1 Tax=Phenylobacterium sp. TaxID=1871053 RepID=UPI0030F3BA50
MIIHIALFTFLFATASGDLISGGGGGPQGPVINVSLVGPTAPRIPQTASAGGGALQPLFAKYRTASEGLPVPVGRISPNGDFSRLVNRLQQPAAQQQDRVEAKYPDSIQHSPERVSPTANRTSSPGYAAANGETAGSASAGDLWGRIEPCWRNLSTRVERPVTLEVSLDATGGLSRPPSVVRETNEMLDEQRLRAEARALQALAGCLPRGDLSFARRVYRLEFTAER